ncbi:uncharacterized protein N7498_001018 [Penicillium cinerascens]|uniref:Uncharacterized protein n=1 Tax=Penicillium cinerascens TaxID=70096 RepID=A0A9W9NHQ9_9EURO|nr:uncharacterized protein N7498_001018 [Penicillium cinerascens]KAJ5218919.1 hypothetical protein N7498_001018 [Penicillium cinerascens]
MSRLISKVLSQEMELEELTAHASTLVHVYITDLKNAGGETVATFLAATMYHLLSTPKVYENSWMRSARDTPMYPRLTLPTLCNYHDY